VGAKTGQTLCGVAHHEPLEAGLTPEIQQQADSTAGCFQVIQDLRLRVVLDRGSSFHFHEDNSRYLDIRVKGSDEGLSEAHGY
jgi:hypothetical protein